MSKIDRGLIRGDGVRDFYLEARESVVRIGGEDARVLAYNGLLPGPTLHAHEGERGRVVFRNGTREPTNLHLHGMHSVDHPRAFHDDRRVSNAGVGDLHDGASRSDRDVALCGLDGSSRADGCRVRRP